MFDTRTRLFFACLKDAAGAALKNAAPAPSSNQKKIGFGAALNVTVPGGSRSATLVFINGLKSNGLVNLTDQQITEVTFGLTINGSYF